MSTQEEEFALVKDLNVTMLKKLRENCDKNSWGNYSCSALMKMLRKEVEELGEALTLKRRYGLDSGEVMRECADVANFAAMIYSNIQKKD